ncbi:hypothetical protein ACFQ6Q_28360 [Streptomyces sp. NPDC056437]|uniref:hypothetical protein n=1 Tax=Streptomyces sp. NPDC056437 TaxID=3345816 RepID=UPI00368F37C4
MTESPGRYADFESLREQALTLRREGLSRRQIRDRLHVHNNDILNRLLQGEPVPEWTKRPNAKDDLRARARELRLAGMTYDQIQLELGCSKSSISLWVRDLPKPPAQRTPAEQAKLASDKRWEHERPLREAERRRTTQEAFEEIGTLTDRELFLLGVGLYWSEGAKSKPYRRQESVTFINSDADMIRVYLAWLALLDVKPDRLRYRVMIHESADVEGAECYWAAVAGIDTSALSRTTLKRHNPKTVRKNVGDAYRGCFVVRVLGCAELYRRIEGWWCGIVVGSAPDGDRSPAP